MICPRCGGSSVSSEQRQAVNVSVKMKRGSGCLWWLLLGWIYLIYVMFVWTFKIMYLICIGWWVAILQKRNKEKYNNAVIHICQNCGNRWETK